MTVAERSSRAKKAMRLVAWLSVGVRDGAEQFGVSVRDAYDSWREEVSNG